MRSQPSSSKMSRSVFSQEESVLGTLYKLLTTIIAPFHPLEERRFPPYVVKGCRSLFRTSASKGKGTWQKPYLILIECSSSSSCPSSSCTISQGPLIGFCWPLLARHATITKTETGRYVIILLGHMSTFGFCLDPRNPLLAQYRYLRVLV